MNQRKKQEKIELASKGVNCSGIVKEDVREDDNVSRHEAQCGFCRKIFGLDSILKHIGNNEACKLFYGPEFEQKKKNLKNFRNRLYREKNGTEKELQKQRDLYASNLEIREKRRKSTKNGGRSKISLYKKEGKMIQPNEFYKQRKNFQENKIQKASIGS